MCVCVCTVTMCVMRETTAHVTHKHTLAISALSLYRHTHDRPPHVYERIIIVTIAYRMS